MLSGSTYFHLSGMLITLLRNVLIINLNYSYHHLNVDNFAEKHNRLRFTRLVFHPTFPNFKRFVFENNMGEICNVERTIEKALSNTFLYGDLLSL